MNEIGARRGDRFAGGEGGLQTQVGDVDRGLWQTFALGEGAQFVAARQPAYVKAGAVTRLQAAGFTGKADADAFCADLRKGGQACMVVSK